MLAPHPSAFDGSTASLMPQVLRLATTDDCSTEQPPTSVSAAVCGCRCNSGDAFALQCRRLFARGDWFVAKWIELIFGSEMPVPKKLVVDDSAMSHGA